MERRINAAGMALLKHWEQLRLEAYPDPCSPDGNPWTIGWGHTVGVYPGLTITEYEAELLLAQDLDEAERVVNEAVKVDLSDNEFSALVVFVHNVGAGSKDRPGHRGRDGFVTLRSGKPSSLLASINAGEPNPDHFLRWNKAGVPPMPVKGLTARRFAERQLFLKKESAPARTT